MPGACKGDLVKDHGIGAVVFDDMIMLPEGQEKREAGALVRKPGPAVGIAVLGDFADPFILDKAHQLHFQMHHVALL